MRQLRFLRFWLALGWLLVGLVIFLSLIPSPPEPPGFAGVDKLLHLSAYAVMMLWFGFIYLQGKTYRNIGLIFIMIGLILEFIQGATGYRSMDFFDMSANALGVLSGWLLAKTPFSSLLIQVEERIAYFV